MAGIFSDVSTDIQKLRQLKAEIENVKKSLKGIDVNVNIDIAKGMEAQLQSLMKQYDALVRKVSEAEGKIMISTKRINDASEKIIKAQEKLSKAAGTNTQPSNGNADVSLNNVGTANVQAQAKAYDELAEEIDSVMGTRSQNIKRMIDEQNAIRLINEEIKKLTKFQTGNSTLTNTQQKRLEQLNNSLLTHKAALSDVRQTLMNNVKLDNSATTSMNGISQSLSRMRIAYRELTEEERNSPFGKELLASIQQADAKIKELDATIGNHQRNVGNYVKGYNGLNMSVQQIVRELPSAAMGLNMFFLAISNNLPILTDEIKRAKAANEELKVSGQKGVPVWKQVASSLFSWQSALMVGITLLTVHGDKVWEWISSLFKAKDTATSLSGVTSELNKSMSENNTGYGKNIATLNKLQSKWKELDGDLSKQKTFIYENKDAFSELGVSINDVNDAEKILSDNTGKFIKTLDLRAAAAAYQLAIKKAEEAFQHGIAADEILNGGANFWDYWNAGIDVLGNLDWVIQGGDVWNPEKFTQGRAGKELIASDKANSQFQMLMQLSEQFAEKRKESLKQMGLTDDDMNLVGGSIEAIEAAISAKREALKKVTNRKDYIKIESEIKTEEAKLKAITGNTTKEQQEKERQKKEQEQLAEELLQLRLKNQQEEINLMDEGSEKKRRQIELDYQKEIEAYNKAKAKYGETDEIKAMKSNAETKRFSGLAAINEEEQKKEQERIKAQEDAWNEALIKFGDYNQKRKAIIEKYNKEIAQAQNAGEELAKTEEKKAALEELDEQYGKSSRVMADLFEDAGEKSVTAIQKIIDKYETLVKYLSGTEQSDGTPVTLDELKEIGFTDKDIESIERGEISIRDLTDALKNMNGELKGKSPWMSFVNDMQKSIGKIKSAKGDSEKIGEGVMGIGNAVTDFAPALGEFAENIGSIFGVDGEKIQGIVGSIQGLGQTATGVGQILSGDIVGGAMSAVGGISKVVSSLDNLFGADYSEYENMKAQYDTLISVWDTLIGKKTEYIDIDYGTEAQKAAEEAIKLTETQIERQRQLANMLASSGASVGSHSLGYRVNDRMSSQDWQRLSGLVGQQVDSLDDVLKLDTDVIGKVLQDEKFVNVLTTVNSDFIEYIQNIEKYGEQLEEIANKEQEAITGIGFDAFRDGYIDMLADLSSSNEDFADNFEKQLQNAIFRSLIANKYTSQIQNLYDEWVRLGEDGLTKSEVEYLRNLQQNLTDKLVQERENMKDLFGWKSEDKESTDTAIEGLEELQKAYEKLSEASSKAFSSEAVKILKQQNENLNEQMSLIRKRIDEENRSANPDTDYLDELKGQLEDINAQIEDNKEAMKDAIFGEDIQSAISNFMSAYTEALGDGGSMQKMSKDFVESMVQNMVTESMKADASPIMENIREKLIEAWKDGVVTADEQLSIEEIVNNLNKELSEKYGWAEGLFGKSDIEGLEALQDAYDRLSDSVSDAYSSEKAELLRQQNEILRQQRDLILGRLEAEKALGERGDTSLIDGWESELEDVEQQIKDNKDAQLDAIFGQETKTQISNLANALIDVWSGAEKKADSAKDFINGIIKSMVLESLSMDLTPFIEDLRGQMADMFEDGIISADEGDALAGMVENIMDSLEKQYEWADRFIKEEEEVVEEMAETFSNITFESMRDDFTSQLSDMTSSYEDMCNDFEDKLKESIIRGFIKSKYQNQIQNLISTWDMYGASGNIDSDEMEKLREQYRELISSMIKDRDELAEQFGWSRFQQEATSKGFESMSQDSADELNGRFTAMYESDLRREAIQSSQLEILREIAESGGIQVTGRSITELSGNISDLHPGIESLRNIADETRTILANSYLELQQIRENTEDSAKYLKDIKTDIAEVKRNTARL